MSLEQPSTPIAPTASQSSDAEPVLPAPRVRPFPIVGANPGPRCVIPSILISEFPTDGIYVV